MLGFRPFSLRGLAQDTDVHLHVSGAAPKDGAAAGVTMAAALVSACTGRPLHAGTAMTGEITLSGHVLPVGGIRDKVLAVHGYGLTRASARAAAGALTPGRAGTVASPRAGAR